MPKCDWFFALLCPQSLSKENLGKTFSLTLARNKSWNKKKILNASCCWHDATAYRIFSKSSSSASPVVWNLCKSPVWFCSNLLSKFHPPFSFFFQSACGGVFRAVVFWDWLTARPRKIEIANQYRTLIRAHRMSITAKKEKRGSRAYTRVMCQS